MLRFQQIIFRLKNGSGLNLVLIAFEMLFELWKV